IFFFLFYIFFFFFFFQAEDGIRDRNVTGVQTCALPILMVSSCARLASWTTTYTNPRSGSGPRASMYVAPFGISGRSSSACCVERSEERRVGKECRCRWAACE